MKGCLHPHIDVWLSTSLATVSLPNGMLTTVFLHNNDITLYSTGGNGVYTGNLSIISPNLATTMPL